MSGTQPDDVAASLRNFLLVAMIGGTSVGFAKIAMPLMALALGADAMEIGWVGGMQSLGMLLMGIPVGILVDRFGPRRFFIAGGLTGALVYAALPFARTPFQLLLGALLAGLCVPLRMVPNQSVFLGVVSSLQPARVGWFRAAHMSGMHLTGPLAGGLIAGTLALNAVFVGISALHLVTLTLGAGLFKRGRFGATRGGRGNQASAPVAAHPMQWVMEALQGPALVDFFSQIAFSYFGIFGVVIAVQVLHFSPTGAAGLIAASGICFIAVLMCGGSLPSERGQFGPLLGAMAATILLGQGGQPYAFVLGALCLGTALGFMQLANLHQYAGLGQKHGAGKVAGMIALAGPAGGLCGAVIGGMISHRWGLFAMFNLLTLLFAGLAITTMVRNSRRGRA